MVRRKNKVRLFIAEKPSLGEAIAQCLSGRYQKHRGSKGPTHITVGEDTVSWCFGHIYEMLEPEEYDPAWGRWTMASLPLVPCQWGLKPKREAKEQIRVIKDLIAKCSVIIHAGDPDREGQLLIDEVLEKLHNKKPVLRLWLSATDEKSVRKALACLKDNREFRPLRDSAEARSWGDWLVGINATRKMTLLGQKAGVQGVLSVGRVQTPTLAMVVARDKSIEDFREKDFYNVVAEVGAEDARFTARWIPSEDVAVDDAGRLVDKRVAEAICTKIKGSKAMVQKSECRQKSESQPLAYSLDKLQMECNKILGLSAQETLSIAQQLYEAKLISYPRSDSGYLPESQFADAKEILGKLATRYGKEVAAADPAVRSPTWNDKKITAHHGIIPTGVIVDLEGKKADVFDVIVRRYLAQFYPAYRFQESEIELSVAGEILRTKGRRELDLGWKVLCHKTVQSDEEQKSLPQLSVGSALDCVDVRVESKKTTPPARYNEAALLAAMLGVHQQEKNPEIKKRLKESAGIGTPATRAGIIETLKKRGLIEEKKKSLISTPKGRDLIAALPDSLKSPGLTAIFEQLLDGIAGGHTSKQQFLAKQVEFVTKFIHDDCFIVPGKVQNA